jgi:glutathione S-transferase
VGKPRLNLGPADEALIARAQADLARFAPVLERHLAGRQYIVGDGLTIADYSMVPFEGYRKLVPFDWTAYPNINAYFDRIRASEAWQRTAVRDPATIGRRPKAA